MKRLLSFLLGGLIVGSSFVSCAPVAEYSDTSITVASSDAVWASEWLTQRLGTVSHDVVVGVGSDDSYGVDMTSFEDDGYIVREMGGDVLIFGKTADGLDRGVRAYAKACESGTAEELDLVYHEGERIEKLTVGGRDISEYKIKLAGNVDVYLENAAAELAKYIELSCGFLPEYSTEDSAHMLVLEQITKDDPRYETLGKEGFTIAVEENGDIRITGGIYRGCIYGVYEFLENHIGWRFLPNGEVSADIDYLFEAAEIDIPTGTSETQAPGIDSRGILYNYTPITYNAKIRDNYRSSSSTNAKGVHRVACHGVQSGPFRDMEGYEPYSGLPAAQPCYTSEYNIDVSVEYFTDYLTSRMDAGQIPGEDIMQVDVSQVDSGVFCVCPDCRKLVNLDGSDTGPVLNYTNLMADAIAEISPDVYAAMLSYWGTTKPPRKTLPRENVAISYCYYNDIGKLACYSHSLRGEECEHYSEKYGVKDITNAIYSDELEAWCEIATRVDVWYYPGVWYYGETAFSTLKTVRDDMRYMAEIGVDCVFRCPTYSTRPSGYSAPNEDILQYIIPKLAWDPYMSDEEFEALVLDYYYIMVGDGYKEIYEFEKLMIECMRDSCYSSMAWSAPSQRMVYSAVKDNFSDMSDCLEYAVDNACSAEQEAFAEKLSLRIYFTGLAITHTEWYLEGDGETKAEYARIYGLFKERALEYSFAINNGEADVVVTEESFDISVNIGDLMGTLGEDIWYEG